MGEGGSTSHSIKPSKGDTEKHPLWSPEEELPIIYKKKLPMKKDGKCHPPPQQLEKLCFSSEFLTQWLPAETCSPSIYRHFLELSKLVWGESSKDEKLAENLIDISVDMVKLRALLEMVISIPVDTVNLEYSDLLDSVHKFYVDTADHSELNVMIRQLSNPRRLLLILSLRTLQSRIVAPILVQAACRSYRGLESELYDWLRDGYGELCLQDLVRTDDVRCQCVVNGKGEKRFHSSEPAVFKKTERRSKGKEGHPEVSRYSERVGTDELVAYAVNVHANVHHFISVIDVFNSVLGDIGAVRLSAMLPEIPSLKKLYLWQAEIGDIGAAAIAAALPKCQKLTALDLHGNWIGDKGGRKLVEGIAESKTLKAVFLHRNPIGPSITYQLKYLPQPYSSHVSLKVVYVSEVEHPSSQAKFVTTRPYVSFGPSKGFGEREQPHWEVRKHFQSGNFPAAAAVIEDGAEFPSEVRFNRCNVRRILSPMAQMELCRLGSLLQPRRVSIDASAISCQSDSLHLHALRKMLYGNSRLEYLRLYCVRNLDAISLAEALPQCMSLTDIEVHGSNIGDEGASAIAEVLPHCPKLKKINLSSNRIGVDGATAIAEALPQCTALSVVKFDSNGFGDDGISAIAEALPNCPAMSHVALWPNEFSDEGVKAIARALPKCVWWTNVNLSNNEIGDEGARAIMKALPKCTTVSSISLYYNRIGDAGAAVIATALPKCAWWTNVDLSGNQIGDEGARAIAEALPSANAVSSINLRGNKIGTEGATAIAEALPQCPVLSKIDLGDNKIGDGGAISIAKALPDCKLLSSTNLNSNQIGDDGAVAIAAALPAYESLSWIYLSRNDIGDKGAMAIAEALPRCNSKLKINLYSNKFSTTGKELLNPFKQDKSCFY